MANVHTVCPYFTMFPLDFPLGLLGRAGRPSQWVLDPFCGRGTTSFAARLLGLGSFGIDANPVAAAVASAKVPRVSPDGVLAAAARIIGERGHVRVPVGPFWRLAFNRDVLGDLCRLRQSLLRRCSTPERIALRAIILGALHGPRTKGLPSYFSNQAPRTYAPKPEYAVRFWRRRSLTPPRVDALDLLRRRVQLYFTNQPAPGRGEVILGDSRDSRAFRSQRRFDWVITSPPYYGMRTYGPDQWLRMWFLGGPPRVCYDAPPMAVRHTGPETFAGDLRAVWTNCGDVCRPGARLVVRFGAIRDRAVSPLDILRRSLQDTPWRTRTIRDAGNASRGKRQAEQFRRVKGSPLDEHDLYAVLEP